MNETSITNLGTQAILGAKAVNENATKKEDATEKLHELAAVASHPLFVMETVFPFDVFSDRVTIDREKITIQRRFFFFDSSVQSVLIKDIATVVVEQSLLVASLQIINRMPTREVIKIDKLPKEKARTARWIIEGLIVSSQQQELDLTKIPNEDLVPKLIEIGKAKNP